MVATVHLTRQTSFGFELVRRPFQVLIDGVVVGVLATHATSDITAEPGSHTLLLRCGRRRSPQRTFDVPDGDAVTFTCSGAKVWPTWALSFLIPSVGIALHQQ